MAKLNIYCLGAFQATLAGESITTAFDTDKTRALLAYLALEAGRPHRREHLAALFWSDTPEERALHNLRQALSLLKKQLPEDRYLSITRETVQFNLQSDHWLDVRAFTAALELAYRHYQRRDGLGHLQAQPLKQAVALYRNRLLDQFSLTGGGLFDEWVALKREDLDRQAIEAMTLLAEYHSRRGEYLQARQSAARIVELAPWDENAHQQLMLLLAQDGQWSAAQNQYQVLRRYLDREMDVAPLPEITECFEQIRKCALAGGPSSTQFLSGRFPLTPHHLPDAPQELVGREEELALLAEMLADYAQRLITICGPGGIGKTVLAIEAAREQVGVFRDGVFFVPLGSLSGLDPVVPAIAGALGCRLHGAEPSETQLQAYLRGKDLLLVLDNVEHLPAAEFCELLVHLLEKCAHLQILATSRSPLNLRCERLLTVSGLAYPGEAGLPPENGTFSALDLFYRAARRAWPAAEPQADPLAAAKICRLLEGVPLAIELAAAWSRSLPYGEIARQIEASLDFISTNMQDVPVRHRSLRAVFDQTWNLLSLQERQVMQNLSIFRGSFTAQAAAEVALSTVEVQKYLVENFLLRRVTLTQRGPALAPQWVTPGRCELHPMVRQYTAEQLARSRDQAALAAERHAHFYAALLQAFNAPLKGTDQPQALDTLSQEAAEFPVAWECLIQNDRQADLLAALDSLYLFYEIQSQFKIGIQLLSTAAGHWPLPAVLNRLAALHRRVGQFEQAELLLEQSLALLVESPDPAETAFVLSLQSDLAQHKGQYQQALDLSQSSLDLYRSLGDPASQSNALYNLGLLHYRLGRIPEARQALEHSLQLARGSSPLLQIGPLNVLADVMCHLGDYEQAVPLFQKSLEISRQLGNLYGAAIALNNLGTVEQVLERYPQAQASYQESLALCRRIGDQAGEAIALSNLGEVSTLQLNSSEARRYAHLALDMGRELQDQWISLAALNALAEVELSCGNQREAWQYAGEAVRLALSSQARQMLARSLVTAGQLLVQAGKISLGGEVLSVVSGHPACQDDYKKKAEQCLQTNSLSPQPGPQPALEELAARIGLVDCASRPDFGDERLQVLNGGQKSGVVHSYPAIVHARKREPWVF